MNRLLLASTLGFLLGNIAALNGWTPVVDYFISSGTLNFNPHEIQSGYVNIGSGTTLFVHKDNPRFHRLIELEGKDVQLVVRVGGRELERLK